MDEMRSVGPELDAPEPDGALPSAADDVHHDSPPDIGNDERRMHVRAYNFWVSLLGTRAYPSVADLAPAELTDFGPHSVLLDFSDDASDPAIAYLGETLRLECAVGRDLRTIADVPARSLLSRLTDHYLQILANRAPIGFEAEFVGQRGNPTMYRGILMPFSSDGATIDFVYGVINWKELAEPDIAAALVVEVEQAMGAIPQIPVWADGPGAVFEADADATIAADGDLAERLAAARAVADAAQGARRRSRAALYRALGLAYDLALAADSRSADYAALLADAGIKVQKRAPMTAIVRLVFGTGIDKARSTEFAAALAHGRRLALPAGNFASHVEAQHGGLKALVAAERVARRAPDTVPSHQEIALAALRRAPQIAHLDMGGGHAEFVLLLARRDPAGGLAVIAPVPDESGLVDRAIRKITR
jgi:hypothetical protein